MYDEMTSNDFICTMIEAARRKDDPREFYAGILEEAARRIRKLEDTVNEWESAADGASGADTPDGLRNFIAACE